MSEKRALKRRSFSYYMRVLDDSSRQTVGYMADISPHGFKLDCSTAIPDEKDLRLRVELTSDFSTRTYVTFLARSKWCRPDNLDPFSFNVGFEIVSISPVDEEIFLRIVDRYAAPV